MPIGGIASAAQIPPVSAIPKFFLSNAYFEFKIVTSPSGHHATDTTVPYHRTFSPVVAHNPTELSLGWSWSDVRVTPATINNLLLKGLVEEKFHSNSHRGLLLTELGREQASLLEEPAEAHGSPSDEDPMLPDDMFQDIIGHYEVKELLTAVLLAGKPVHVLLAGPPALAKSLFLWDIKRVYDEYYDV